MAWISYAQALEDIHLLRALAGVHHDEGFYIDVGGVEGHDFIDGSLAQQIFRFPKILDWIRAHIKPRSP